MVHNLAKAASICAMVGLAATPSRGYDAPTFQATPLYSVQEPRRDTTTKVYLVTPKSFLSGCEGTLRDFAAANLSNVKAVDEVKEKGSMCEGIAVAGKNPYL